MQTTLEVPSLTPAVSEADDQQAAHDYVAAYLDPAFEVVEGARFHHKPLGRENDKDDDSH